MRTRLSLGLACLLLAATWLYLSLPRPVLSADLVARAAPGSEAPESGPPAHPPGLFTIASDISGDDAGLALDLAPPPEVTITPRPASTASPSALSTKSLQSTIQTAPTRTLAPTRPAPSPTPPAPAPSGLANLVARVKTGRPGTIVGVYSPGVLSLRVLIQPWGDPNWVSDERDTATLFVAAAKEGKGTIGLLAHNGLAGASFLQIGLGQELDIVLGDGAVLPFHVSEVQRYQAFSPNDPSTPLKDLTTGRTWSADDAFNRVYGADGSRVVLQTCIKVGDEWNWGRLFVIATAH